MSFCRCIGNPPLTRQFHQDAQRSHRMRRYGQIRTLNPGTHETRHVAVDQDHPHG